MFAKIMLETLLEHNCIIYFIFENVRLPWSGLKILLKMALRYVLFEKVGRIVRTILQGLTGSNRQYLLTL